MIRIPHPHVIVDNGYAIGQPDRFGHHHITALGYRCVLCGARFDVVTAAGLQQIAAGVRVADAVRWTAQRRKVT